MSINKATSSSEEPKKHIFQDNQKEDFVSLVVESSSDCFQWYDEWFIKDLIYNEYASQEKFDALANRLLDSGVIHYFDVISSKQEPNPFFVDELKTSLTSMIDQFVWSYNDFRDKLLEHANSLSTVIIQQQLDLYVKDDVENTIRSILDTIPELVKAKEDATAYFAANKVNVTNMFVYPNVFVSEFPFIALAEQPVVVHLINTEYQKFQIRLEKTKKDLMDSINPKEIDCELFHKLNHTFNMIIDWRGRVKPAIHTRIMNIVHSRYIVNTLANASVQKFPFKA